MKFFTIAEVIDTRLPTYKLENYGPEKIEGSFYEKEIQRAVKTENVFKIEKILSTESAKVSRNILSSGKTTRKNSIRGLANPT